MKINQMNIDKQINNLQTNNSQTLRTILSTKRNRLTGKKLKTFIDNKSEHSESLSAEQRHL